MDTVKKIISFIPFWFLFYIGSLGGKIAYSKSRKGGFNIDISRWCKWYMFWHFIYQRFMIASTKVDKFGNLNQWKKP